MAFKWVGFYRELFDNEPGAPSLREAVRPNAHPEEERIVAYLKAGVGLAGVGKYVGDVLNPAARFAVSPSLLTDGVWLWRADLPYYVATYHVELPDEFVAHMRQNGWAVPVLNEAEESRLGRQLFRDMGGHDAEPLSGLGCQEKKAPRGSSGKPPES
jgi:hypothetical protein